MALHELSHAAALLAMSMPLLQRVVCCVCCMAGCFSGTLPVAAKTARMHRHVQQLSQTMLAVMLSSLTRNARSSLDSHEATTALNIALAQHVTPCTDTKHMGLASAPRAHALLLVMAKPS